MGVSTNAQLCFGVLFDEDTEFPWDTEDYAGDIEEWWLTEVCGYQPSVALFDAQGEYLAGRRPSEEALSHYFAEKRAFAKAHPVPPP